LPCDSTQTTRNGDLQRPRRSCAEPPPRDAEGRDGFSRRVNGRVCRPIPESYFFFARAGLRRGALPVAPAPGGGSLSAVRSDLVPCGTIAATTGFLSVLRSCKRGGFSLMYSSPHWRSAVSAMFKSSPFFVRWYSYRSGRSL